MIYVYGAKHLRTVHSTSAPRKGAWADRDGLAAAQGVDKKARAVPPARGAIPLVFGTGGRPSDEAASFARSYGVDLDGGERSELLGGLWRQFSRTL